jgi:hypothetical protein
MDEDHDALRAERLLYGIAGDLRRLPIHQTLGMHLRALQIKRALLRWKDARPDEGARRATLADLAALQADVEAQACMTLLRAPEVMID